MRARRQVAILTVSALSVIVLGCASESPTLTPTATATATPKSAGHELFIAKGCAACHGLDAEGSAIAPALPGHTEQMVKRQVRNPRFRMPAFSQNQVSDEELEVIADYIVDLQAEGHAHRETIELAASVEMHHWMALEALKADGIDEGIHHVKHIVELLEPGIHRTQMEAILVSLQAGERHDPEHEIEGMLAGTAAPELTLLQLHLRQALVGLAIDDLADAQHHVIHAHELAEVSQKVPLAEIQLLLDQADVHGAEDEIRELLGITH